MEFKITIALDKSTRDTLEKISEKLNINVGAVQQVQPVQPVQQVQAVATKEPVYSLQELALAATQVMDAGQDVVGLLSKFGVQALTQLDTNQYGAFASELRVLGAKI